MSGTLTHKAALAALFVVAAGCTTVVVKKDPCKLDRGIRYWRPKPYLFIGPYGGQQSTATPAPTGQSNQNSNSTGGGGPTASKTNPSTGNQGQGAVQLADSNFIKVSMEIKYLPDYNEEYSIKLRPGIGTGSLGITLQDGWNLTSVNMQTDQKLPELISSIGGLIGAVTGKGGAAGGGSTGTTKGGGGAGGDMYVIVDTRPDVPLGFYEPIIATDPNGRKSMFGWRYVGFLPFAGCPVTPCLEQRVVTCSDADLYGLIATSDSIKFARLSEIQNPAQNWPYQWKRIADKPSDGGLAPRPTKQSDSNQDDSKLPSDTSPTVAAITALVKQGIVADIETGMKQVAVAPLPTTPVIMGVSAATDKILQCTFSGKVYYVVLPAGAVYLRGTPQANAIEKAAGLSQ